MAIEENNNQDGGSHIESLMSELGMDPDPASAETEGAENPENKSDESQKDLSVSNETKDVIEDKTTELDPDKDSLQSQITGMEKRINDKDTFIKSLQDQIKAKETKADDDTKIENKDDEPEDGFWDKPEETIKGMQEQIRIQNLQIQEAVFAGGVEDYFKTVNGNDLKEAVSNDSEFADKFNSSPEPYKVAYEYLKNKTVAKTKVAEDARAALKAELLEEIRSEGGKTPPANINSIGSSNNNGKSDADDDGFASVFEK